jgi:quinol monooxygenase YgiN
MTYVVTYVEVQPGSITEAVALLAQYRDATRAEQGNSGIDVLQETCRSNRFVIVEVWRDETFFQIHERAPHTAEFRSRLKAVHQSPYDQRVHHDFAVGPEALRAAADALCVVTHVDVPPPRRDETEVLLKRLAEQSRRDDGNLRYDVFQQIAPRTNHFTVFAAWDGEDAFASHARKPDTRQFREALGPMLGAPYDERLYKFRKN